MNQFKVNIDNEQENIKVPKGVRMLVRRCCKAVLHEEHKENFENVKIIFTEDRKLNELRGQNELHEAEDIFAVTPCEKESDEQLGEVYISLERALKQSVTYNNSFEAEVVYLAAHGVFQLLGYRNLSNSEKAKLKNKEKKIVQTLGMSYQTHA